MTLVSTTIAGFTTFPHTVSPTRSYFTNLSTGAISGIVVAVVIVFVVLVISIVSCAIHARVQGSRLQNIHRGTAAANSNFPATSSNFAYAPLPQEPPPPYPGSPTDGNNNYSDFAAQTQPQLPAQQPASSHDYAQEYPTQQVPYGAPSYPQPTAESEGATDTAPQLHSESDNNDSNIAVQPQDHYEAPTVGSVPPPNQLPYPLSDLVYPPTAAGVVSYPTVAGDSDANPQPPPSD